MIYQIQENEIHIEYNEYILNVIQYINIALIISQCEGRSPGTVHKSDYRGI